jgi:tellurite resistance protein
MSIEDMVGEGAQTRFVVAFHQRRLADIAAMGGDRAEEVSLAAVARSAEAAAAAYDGMVRPVLRAAVPPPAAAAARWMQPLRAQRWAFASANPLMAAVAPLAAASRAVRRPAGPDNPFAQAEAVGQKAAAQMLDAFRDLRDMGIELAFHTLWGHPGAVLWGRVRDARGPRRDAGALRQLPQVQQALARTGAGGFAEAVIRMLILLADARGSVRRDRLERSARVLSQESPFAELGAEARAAIIAEQSVIARIDPDAAIGTLPKLLRLREDRRAALAVVLHILGPPGEMEPHTVSMLARFRAVLDDRSLSLLDAAE